MEMTRRNILFTQNRACLPPASSPIPEWELALARWAAGQCLFLPIFVGEVRYNEAEYPLKPSFQTGVPIRRTLIDIFKLNGLRVRPGSPEDLAAAAAAIRTMVATKERYMQRAQVRFAGLKMSSAPPDLWQF